MAEEPPRGSYAIKYVCMYVCMYLYRLLLLCTWTQLFEGRLALTQG